MTNVDRIAEILRDRFAFMSTAGLDEIATEVDAALHPAIDNDRELDALPVGSVVLDANGLLQRFEPGWIAPGARRRYTPKLPATVLYTPDADL